MVLPVLRAYVHERSRQGQEVCRSGRQHRRVSPHIQEITIIRSSTCFRDLGQNHFDLAIPGGGVGLFNACTQQYGAPPNGWGAKYGGVSSAADCEKFPAALKAGCDWRFGWVRNSYSMMSDETNTL